MKTQPGRRLSKFLCAAALLLCMPAARADTLTEALAQTYLTNPTLNAARAGQRATDEQVPQALSGWRPTITVEGEAREIEGTTTNRTTKIRQSIDSAPGALTIVLAQPVFRGFATVEGTKAAEATVRAGQQNLLATEQNVLFDAVQAYMNVYSDRQLVALQQENVVVLRGQLKASNERFNVGEITRTDVAQSQASLGQAQATLADQQAILAADAATYLQVIGHPPGRLKYPRTPKLPASLEAAYATAGEINPDILAAAFVEDAAYHNIGVQRAPLLPELSVRADATISDELHGRNGNKTESASLGGFLSVPIYEAGLVYSRVREAKQLASQRRIQIIEVARSVRQAVAAAWNAYLAYRQIIAAGRQQVSAARLALEGVRQEYSAGTRTTLDILNAQAAVVIARTTLVNAERNRVVAAYQLLAAIGELTAIDLRLGVPYYNIEENYRAVRNKWIGTDVQTVD
jgi:TolC family type I secretion outer membrane protein